MKIIDSTLQKKSYSEVAKFTGGKIGLPYYKEGVTVMSPGTWNDTRITRKACEDSFARTAFDTQNSSIFLNHEEDKSREVGRLHPEHPSRRRYWQVDW